MIHHTFLIGMVAKDHDTRTMDEQIRIGRFGSSFFSVGN